jgi:hypothetical protein
LSIALAKAVSDACIAMPSEIIAFNDNLAESLKLFKKNAFRGRMIKFKL